ncbi:MAG: SulP family inorganic anion transporter [Rubrivivax sp.]|nr:SulP family inorganic anion transporter [Rubrivivax sp.]
MPPAWTAHATRWLGPWVAAVDRRTLRADALAGLVGALIVLPQGIAFAALAGLPPAWGLYTSIVPCIVAALGGSSRLMVSGPSNATALALAAMLAPLAAAGTPGYLQLALAATLGLGLLQASLGVLRLGALANFVSPSVLLGFTTGAALLIAGHAAQDLALGWAEAAVGALTLAAALLARRWFRSGQHLLIGLLAGGLGAAGLHMAGWPTAQVGAISAGLPDLSPPPMDVTTLQRLVGITVALAIVSLGQTMAIGKALAVRHGDRFDPNRECLAQGASNIVGSFFSCFVASGSLNRSVVNEQAGARTPLAAVASALIVAALLLLGAALLAWIPLAAIAALLLLVAWSLFDRSHWQRVIRLDRTEAAIAAGTCAATLLLSLEVAIIGGVTASLVTYLVRSAKPALRSMGFDLPPGHRGYRPFIVIDDAPPEALPECPQLKLLRMEGSVYFGAVAHVADHLHRLREGPAPQRHLLVMAKSMTTIDLAGADVWEAERIRRVAMGGDLYFHRPRPPVLDLWRRSGFLDRLGADHVFDSKPAALAGIVARLDNDTCARCTARIFAECAQRPGAAPPG